MTDEEYRAFWLLWTQRVFITAGIAVTAALGLGVLLARVFLINPLLDALGRC